MAIITNDINNGSLLKQFLFPIINAPSAIAYASTVSDCYIAGRVSVAFDNQALYGGNDVFLTKMNYDNGTRYWTRIWGNSSSDVGTDVQFDPNSGLAFVAGYTTSFSFNGQISSGLTDALLICISGNGTLLWTRVFGGASYDNAWSLAIHRWTVTLFVVGRTDITGFIATFSQNGTVFQMNAQAAFATFSFQDISFSPLFDTAYVVDSYGNLVSVTVPMLPMLTVSSAKVSTLPSIKTMLPSLTPSGSTTATSSLTTVSLTSSVTVDALHFTSFAETETNFSPSLTNAATLSDATFGPDPLLKQSGTIIYLVIPAAALFLVVLFALVCCINKQLHRKPVKKSSNNPDALSDDTSYGLSTSAESTITSMTTLMRSQFELSLPGYLMFKNGPNFRVRKEIAKGGGGVVSVADALTLTLAAYGTSLIVKTVGPGNGVPLYELTDRQQKMLKQEISIMHYFRDEKYIAKLLGWCNDPACILMKLYTRGSLDRWIYGTPVKSMNLLLQFMQDISRGILAMHSAGFAHCDLKPQNVLLDTDEHDELFCCLTDFGITQIVDETTLLVKDFEVMNVNGLSINYAAPEAFQRFRLKFPPECLSADLVMKFDMYSLAVILFELLERRRPWHKKYPSH